MAPSEQQQEKHYLRKAQIFRIAFLLQVLAVLILLFAAISFCSDRTFMLRVEGDPLPGTYDIAKLTDAKCIDTAMEYLGLVTTYQSANARKQFTKAREFISGDFLQTFDREMMDITLGAIETTSRAATTRLQPLKSKVIRNPKAGTAKVIIPGVQRRIVDGQELPPKQVRYEITLGINPEIETNDYGLAVLSAKKRSGAQD